MKNEVNQLKDLHQKYQEANTKSLPDMPFIYDENSMLSLHFHMSSIQSLMYKSNPEQLVLGYTRTMMGFLFFQPEPESIGMIGLGGWLVGKILCQTSPGYAFHCH